MNKHIICILLFWVVSVCGMSQNTSNISGSFDIGPVGILYNKPRLIYHLLWYGELNLMYPCLFYNSFQRDELPGKGFSFGYLFHLRLVDCIS